jgi:HSP20 family protein
MAKPVRRLAPTVFRAMLADVPDWPGSARTALQAFSSARTFRVEELLRGNHYVIRAELPGLDPAKDIEVSVDGKDLTIHAERWQQDEEPYRSEFRYRSASRSVRLPARVDAEDITASYGRGILEVSVLLPEPVEEGTRIPIENADVPDSNQATEPAAGSPATSSAPGTSRDSAPRADSGPAPKKDSRPAPRP